MKDNFARPLSCTAGPCFNICAGLVDRILSATRYGCASRVGYLHNIGKNGSVAIVVRFGVTKIIFRADNECLHTVGSSKGRMFTSANMGRDIIGLVEFIGAD